MVALVHDEHRKVVCVLLRQGLPIVQRTKQAVEDDEGGSMPKRLVVELHGAKVVQERLSYPQIILIFPTPFPTKLKRTTSWT